MSQKSTGKYPFARQDPESDAQDEESLARYLLLLDEMRQEVEEHENTPVPTMPATPVTPANPVTSAHGGKTYVVFNGRQLGIFSDWNDVAIQVNGFPGARHMSYPTLADARSAWSEALCHKGLGPASPEQGPQRDIFTIASSPLANTRGSATLRPLPYALQRATKTGDATPHGSRIKVEEATPCLPQTPAILGVYPSLPSASPLAGGYLHRQHCASTSASKYDRPEDNWWVVSVGNRPGVYRGRANARENAGIAPNVVMHECRDGIEQARRLFIDLFAGRCVKRLGKSPIPSYQPSNFTPPPFVPNDNFWYVVPRGPHPGVYEGRSTAYRNAGPMAEFMLRCESERQAYTMFIDLYMVPSIQENLL